MDKAPIPQEILAEMLPFATQARRIVSHWCEANRALGKDAPELDDDILAVIEQAAFTALQRYHKWVRQEWLACARYDATMEGPKFKGWDRSALDRLRKKYDTRE